MSTRHEAPDEPGWYWYRRSDQHRWTVKEVWRCEITASHLWCGDRNDICNAPENYPGEWLRIDEPDLEGEDDG